MTRSVFNTNTSATRLLLVFIVAIWCWTLFFPALNWPDEIYKVSRVGIDGNLYLDLLSRLSTNYCIVSYVYGSDTSYLSNVFHVRMTGDGGCYYTFKTINALLVIGMTVASAFLLRSDLKKLFLLSLIWPANVFYATGVNQQSVFCVLSILIMVGVIGSNSIWPYLIASAGLILIDRSFVSLTLYLGILIAVRWRPSMSLVILVFMLIAAIFIRPYVESANLFVGQEMTIGDVSERLTDYYDNPLVSLALLFISFVYLGGTNAILGIGIDYLIVFVALAIWLWKARDNAEMRAYLYAFAFTYFAIVSFIPTIQTFRYYVFLLPVLIYFLVQPADRQKKYVNYCIIMNIVYLAQAAIIYG